MARRALRKTEARKYEFASLVECEESEKYGGLHRVEPAPGQWPPKAKSRDDLHPTIFLPCVRCGCSVPVMRDSSPEGHGVEVVIPRPAVKDAAAKDVKEKVPA